MRDWSDEDIARVRHLAETAKLTSTPIARELGVTKNMIVGICRRNGIQLPGVTGNKNGRPPAQIKEAPMVITAAPKKFDELRPLSEIHANECRRFLPGQHGLQGFVCAAETPIGKPWCNTCRADLYKPLRATPGPRLSLAQWTAAQGRVADRGVRVEDGA